MFGKTTLDEESERDAVLVVSDDDASLSFSLLPSSCSPSLACSRALDPRDRNRLSPDLLHSFSLSLSAASSSVFPLDPATVGESESVKALALRAMKQTRWRSCVSDGGSVVVMVVAMMMMIPILQKKRREGE